MREREITGILYHTSDSVINMQKEREEHRQALTVAVAGWSAW
jgi:hypothetical protein